MGYIFFRSVEIQNRLPLPIDDRAEKEGEWWEPEAVWKMHYQVTLEDRRQVEIFRNMKTGSWVQINQSTSSAAYGWTGVVAFKKGSNHSLNCRFPYPMLAPTCVSSMPSIDMSYRTSKSRS